ncbi:sensor histidine kinase [Anaeromicropila populeti]|uniref:histidine kinase n=1 Tax=Anaeromicropila populeti TaxID=37658 RepID=A0A1I6IYP8_9FIRM|nr:HAMP domain-containing sensor histidine kinase [Anaeromicropila populeti]SFR71886.1 Signal transduction histidine kinase [Anaeromicropila populeti]
MKRTLLVKLTICYVLIAVTMFVFLNTYCVNRIKHQLICEKKSVLYKEAHLISSEYMAKYYCNKLSLDDLKTQLSTIDTFLSTRIWIVKENGTIVADTRGNTDNIWFSNVNDIDPNFLSNNYVVNNTLNGAFSEPMLSVVYAVTSNLQVRGYIVMHISMESIDTSTINYSDFTNISLILFNFVLILIFAYVYFITIRPIQKIKTGIKEYTNGNFSYKLNLKGTDEFYQLAAAINYMASELKELDEYQKKFVANVSHDFRSPLTSIKGYAEAILDGTIPTEAQNKYLEIISFETDRLTKLTSNLLTLNNIKYNGAFLEIAPFDIHTVIKNTSASFEGICTKKKITLELTFYGQENLVNGDIGKIQQVLYNLLDNAIKFSHSNSTIHISTTEKNEKIYVSIRDRGIGIPKDSILKIWDRFYKTDNSRGKDKKGTGLGLSIVREIINAHGENITVASTEGVGTEFIFSLPIYQEDMD